MVRTLARLLLLRVLPRRILPIFTVIEVANVVRGMRRSRTRAGSNDPQSRALVGNEQTPRPARGIRPRSAGARRR